MKTIEILSGIRETEIIRITNFDQVNALYLSEGVNLCDGCPFGYTASCPDTLIDQCDRQYEKFLTAKKQSYER